MPITLRSRVQNSRDIAHRTIGIIHVAERHAIFGFQFVQRAFVGQVAAFAVGDRHAQDLARLQPPT